MGFTGGVSATQISRDTYQIAARGNAFIDADSIQRYALRKAAETTVAAGYRYFAVLGREDRSGSVSMTNVDAVRIGSTVYGSAYTNTFVKPGESVMIKLLRLPEGAEPPAGVFDAQDLLAHLTPPPKVKRGH